MNMKTYEIGIYGDGQLARMLGQAARDLAKSVLVFSQNPESSAAKVGLEIEADLHSFLRKSECIIFENEFVDVEPLRGAKSFPGFECIQQIREKINQKQMLGKLSIPTSPYLSLESDNLSDWIGHVQKRFPNGPVYKWSLGGYDGHGTLISPKTDGEAEAFCNQAVSRNVKIYAEEKIKFVTELAMLSCRSGDQFIHYPLVKSEQVNGVCCRVFGPAVGLGVSEALQKQARAYAERIAEAFHIFGSFAVEYFLDEDGTLMVNEIAPRVHNTAHYSQLFGMRSQFHNHIRAATGESLEEVVVDKMFGMRNLIGESDNVSISLKFDWPKWASFVWYEKSPIRRGRKMGHINFSAESRAGLDERMNVLDDLVLKFWKCGKGGDG